MDNQTRFYYIVATSPNAAETIYKGYVGFRASTPTQAWRIAIDRALASCHLNLYRIIVTPGTKEIKHYVWTNKPIPLNHKGVTFDGMPVGSSIPPHGSPWHKAYATAKEVHDDVCDDYQVFPVLAKEVTTSPKIEVFLMD